MEKEDNKVLTKREDEKSLNVLDALKLYRDLWKQTLGQQEQTQTSIKK